jgi:hypothetical protein
MTKSTGRAPQLAKAVARMADEHEKMAAQLEAVLPFLKHSAEALRCGADVDVMNLIEKVRAP